MMDMQSYRHGQFKSRQKALLLVYLPVPGYNLLPAVTNKDPANAAICA